jgi:hypothetical protein
MHGRGVVMVVAMVVAVPAVGVLGREIQHVVGHGPAGAFHQFRRRHTAVDRGAINGRHLLRRAHPHARALSSVVPWFSFASTSSSCIRSSTT